MRTPFDLTEKQPWPPKAAPQADGHCSNACPHLTDTRDGYICGPDFEGLAADVAGPFATCQPLEQWHPAIRAAYKDQLNEPVHVEAPVWREDKED